MSQADSAPVDLSELIARAQRLLNKFSGTLSPIAADRELSQYLEKMKGENEPAKKIVSAQETAVELGSPKRLSVNIVLWSKNPGLIRDRHFCLLGPDLPESAGAERDYAQIILLAIDETAEIDPFRLESLQFLAQALPGVMARVIPGRLWLRVSKTAVSAGITFALLARAIRDAYQKEVSGLSAVESIFVTSSKEVEPFSALASEAKILSGRHKKISLGLGGDYECEELSCGTCEEKPVCDMIREVRAIRRKSG